VKQEPSSQRPQQPQLLHQPSGIPQSSNSCAAPPGGPSELKLAVQDAPITAWVQKDMADCLAFLQQRGKRAAADTFHLEQLALALLQLMLVPATALHAQLRSPLHHGHTPRLLPPPPPATRTGVGPGQLPDGFASVEAVAVEGVRDAFQNARCNGGQAALRAAQLQLSFVMTAGPWV
jgi:diadenosine tetraphosphatase ApaH/serine/threonine PP2A family protein phosphatase